MKIVKNIMILACASSLMFAGVGFHMANNYTGMDAAAGATVTTSYGATYDLNNQTSVGFDSELGMMMYFSIFAWKSVIYGILFSVVPITIIKNLKKHCMIVLLQK